MKSKDTILAEGDLIMIGSWSIFDVKGVVHPPGKAIAFPRFILDSSGDRTHENHKYKKVYSISARFKFLKENLPQYLVHDPVFDETLCEVPTSDIKTHYKPVEKSKELRGSEKLDALETKALRLAELVKEKADISWNAVGVSGSILVGLHTADSDVDPVVYGSENCRKVHHVLQDFLWEQKGSFGSYNQEDLKSLFEFRSKDTAGDFRSFVRTESRKVMQGKFMGTEYFFRFVKDWNEIEENYGDIQYQNVGVVRVEATVADDSEAIFTPCAYEIDNTRILQGPEVGNIEEIVSFRGRFCEQARIGEKIVAEGKVERVIDKRQSREHYRLLLGNRPSDFMVLV
jgi:predicted nucleotidyltransferase